MFGVCESDLPSLYWRYAYYELKKRVQLKIGETVASHMSAFTSLVEVASAALGGKKDDNKVTEDLTQLEPDMWAARIGQLGALNV